MAYFKNFSIKIMAQRVFTIVLCAFLSSFSQEWLKSHDATLALNAGLSVLVQSVFAGLGLDQLVYNFFKQPQVEAAVKILSQPKS